MKIFWVEGVKMVKNPLVCEKKDKKWKYFGFAKYDYDFYFRLSETQPSISDTFQFWIRILEGGVIPTVVSSIQKTNSWFDNSDFEDEHSNTSNWTSDFVFLNPIPIRD